MPAISLNTASALTGIAKRTLWRYIQDGRLKTIREMGGGGVKRSSNSATPSP